VIIISSIQIGTWIFEETSFENRDMIEMYEKNSRYPVTLWSSNFAYLWASQSNNRKTLWKVIDGLLVLFIYNKSKKFLHPILLPLGDGDPDQIIEVLYKCLKFCSEFNGVNTGYNRVKSLNEEQLNFIERSKHLNKYFRIKQLLGIEYHYDIQKTLSLEGKEFEYVRRKLNKFHRNYPNAMIRKYVQNDYDELLQLNKDWKANEKKGTDVFDRIYYENILKHADQLDHIVLVVEIDGKIVGMTSGGVMPNGQGWICFRKGRHEIEGLSELLLVKLTQEINLLHPQAILINDGSDLGEKGLIFFKERFRPVKCLHRYRIFLK
jgi:uncharacterized protein